MPKILELDPHVADLIAAGEVVERPSSVVKELMENSIDAHAGALTVEIQKGGMTYIRVTDDGCGISAEDAPTAFLRHATSKLRDARGLEAIGTLGFRGEALAAIAAVSRVELLTRERGAGEGTTLSLEAGKITDTGIAGCPEGTTIIVRDLFYNTPARLKYMKKDSAEGMAVTSAVIKCALSHPEVSVRYIRDGAEVFHTPGDGRTDSCIYSVFGSDFANGLLEANSSDGQITVHGAVTPPSASRGNRGWQYFFVNGRNVKSARLQAALEQAYKNSLFTGRFPGCVLYIEMKPSMVDVNVHPAKTEVRFLYEKQVFDGVYYAVLAALNGESGRAQIKLPEAKLPETAAPERRKAPAERLPVKKPEAAVPEKEPEKPKQHTESFIPRAPFGAGAERAAMPLRSGTKLRYEPSAPVETRREDAQSEPARVRGATPAADITEEKALSEEPVKTAPEQQSIPGVKIERPFRVIGEALGTYIIVEKGDGIVLIDKHAAHERIIFDRLKREGGEVMSQQLLAPIVIELPGDAAAALCDSPELLSGLGIEVEEFGAGAIAVRRLPSDIDTGEAESLLSELGEKLAMGNTADDIRDELLHSVACKAAIKAGRESTAAEWQEIASRVISGEIKYCPHGRPVSMELTKNTLDRGFRRI